MGRRWPAVGARALRAVLLGWPGVLRLALPLLLGVLLLAGLAVDALFQHDQSTRLDRLRETGTVATGLLAAAHGAFDFDEDAAASARRVEALAAARAVARALSQSFASSPPASAWIAAAPPMDRLAAAWAEVAGNADRLHGLAATDRDLRARAVALESAFLRLRVNGNALLDELAGGEAKPAQMRAAARQLALVERLAAGARALAGDRDLLTWADRVGRDAVAFGEVLNALENGSPSLEIPRVLKRDALDLLAGLAREFRRIVPALEPVLNQTARREDAGPSLAALAGSLERAGSLGRSAWRDLEERAATRFPRPVHLFWLALTGVLASLALTLAGLRERREARSQRAAAEAGSAARAGSLEASRERLRGQLQQLAASLAQVADGQGALRREPGADDDAAVTLAFSALERLTDRMHLHADQGLRLVRGGALLGDVARTLREESRRQGEVMEQMSLATRDMAAGLDPLIQDGLEAGAAARASSAQAREAGSVVTQAVSELEALHRSAEECARRVQRLEDAARQLLSVRELTEDVSELGKLLSLNVAIQASVDSAASRALGRFSDEVQRLSERARGAMLKIDSVHQELRDEAQRAAGASNDSLQRARAAMSRAQGAGSSLQALDQAARQLQGIGERLERRQREHAHRVTSVVRSITALHQSTTVLRRQVDVTVDSSTALADAGCGFEQGLQRHAGAHPQVLPMQAGPGQRAASTPGVFPGRAADPQPPGDDPPRGTEPR